MTMGTSSKARSQSTRKIVSWTSITSQRLCYSIFLKFTMREVYLSGPMVSSMIFSEVSSWGSCVMHWSTPLYRPFSWISSRKPLRSGAICPLNWSRNRGIHWWLPPTHQQPNITGPRMKICIKRMSRYQAMIERRNPDWRTKASRRDAPFHRHHDCCFMFVTVLPHPPFIALFLLFFRLWHVNGPSTSMSSLLCQQFDQFLTKEPASLRPWHSLRVTTNKDAAFKEKKNMNSMAPVSG